jgi:hypothetical protein
MEATMFVGHLAVALAAKRSAPGVNLGWFVTGVLALDLVWPILLLAGVEQVRIVPGATAVTPLVFDSYPWSHSLVMAVLWGLLLAGAARLARVPLSTALTVGLVASHWLLDFASHAPDLPLWPGRSPRLGLGLWNSVPGTLLVEGAMWIAGITLYLRGRPERPWSRRVAFWSLIVVCTAIWASGPWAPPPPSPAALAGFALVIWLLVPWAAFADGPHTSDTAVG